MWILIRVEEPFLKRLTSYLKRSKIWFKLFPEKVYDVRITVGDRIEAFQNRRTFRRVNPEAAWKTCRYLRQIWDWDNLGRGPWPEHRMMENDPAPKGKGWIITATGYRRRVAGDCKNPQMLNYITCPMGCPDYEPTTVEGVVYLMETTAEEHIRRATDLRRQIEFLKRSEETFEEAVKCGKIDDYQEGTFLPRST